MLRDKRIYAYVLDDHGLFADSFSKLLESLNLFHSVYAFYNEQDLIRHLIIHHSGADHPLYMFLDYFLENKTIPSVLNDIRRISKKAKLIVISSITNPLLIRDVLTYEPNGIISKNATTSQVIECIHTINSRNQYFCPYIRTILQEFGNVNQLPFTPREVDLLRLFAKGYTVQDAAEKLSLSKYTVATHRKKMMAKTGCHNITALLTYARQIEVV